MSPEEIPKELLKELSDSEKKLNSLYEKRDHFNEEAKVIRDMRDGLHQQRKRIFSQLDVIKEQKSKLLDEMKAAKARRDTYNEKARNLSGRRRKRDSEQKEAEMYEDLTTLELDIRKLEQEYQTKAHSIAKERDIVKAIEEKRKKILDLREKEPEFKAERVEAESVEDEIKEYRRLSDQEHQKVQEIYLKLQEINKRFDEYRPTLDHLRKEADKKHEEYLKTRQQADSYHKKATELREKVLQMRDERNRIRNEARKVIEDQNKMVNEKLGDEEKLEDAADKAVELLLKKGKISL